MFFNCNIFFKSYLVKGRMNRRKDYLLLENGYGTSILIYFSPLYLLPFQILLSYLHIPTIANVCT